MVQSRENLLSEMLAPKGIHLAPRKRLGKYRLQKRLGKGGYCEVWKARDTVEGIWVALKIPNADKLGQRDNETILREVRLIAQLRHPHIMPLKNADIIDGHAVLATELSVGTLEECSRPMGVRRIISILRQILNGLAYAHEKRMVHCDVSPANIFLFPNGHASLGDFGIGLQVKGRAKTIDEFGTPGYVAPEQAYGKPTYRSDCFSVGLILYEFLTSSLPRWPFHWPPKGYHKLVERTSPAFVRFMKKALAVDPEKRFPNARKMLHVLDESLPPSLKSAFETRVKQTIPDWQQIRRASFTKRYKKVFVHFYPCADCGQPIAESMQCCPWCGSRRNRFDDCTAFSHYCHRCRRGMQPEWTYCPWCSGPGYIPQEPNGPPPVPYHGKCSHCGGRIMRFMQNCPWCHRKIRKKWHIWPFPEVCGHCGQSVDTSFWNYCPWCRSTLL